MLKVRTRLGSKVHLFEMSAETRNHGQTICRTPLTLGNMLYGDGQYTTQAHEVGDDVSCKMCLRMGFSRQILLERSCLSCGVIFISHGAGEVCCSDDCTIAKTELTPLVRNRLGQPIRLAVAFDGYALPFTLEAEDFIEYGKKRYRWLVCQGVAPVSGKTWHTPGESAREALLLWDVASRYTCYGELLV